jgi:Ser/Thr protein kinase RdoA (MazF antagonist)
MPPAIPFIKRLTITLYDLELRSMQSMAEVEFDWRGIYRLHDSENKTWVLRVMQLPNVFEAFTETAYLLESLEQAHYPAPTVRRTRAGDRVGWLDGWATLLLSYMDGTQIERAPAGLCSLAQTTARLHSLRFKPLRNLRYGRCHPNTIVGTGNQLAQASGRVPARFQPFILDLYQAMLDLQKYKWSALTITHGDCWYQNAISTSNGNVVLVDWDNAGIGLPILDLGYLLLTSHFDVTQPLNVKPEEAIIRSILEGYQRERHMLYEETQLLEEAMHFLLAFQIAKQIAYQENRSQEDFPLLLEKLQARQDAIHGILAIARDYLD